MNRKITLVLLPICLCMYILLSSNSGGRASAANADSTGAPGSGSTCVTCHNSGGYGGVSLSIALTDQGTSNAVSAYTPGSTYDLTVSLSNTTGGTPGGYGFQLTALTATGNNPIAGYGNLGSNVQTTTLGSGRTFIEHDGVSASNSFSAEWTAPSIGTGSVTFYSAGNCVNLDGGTFNDGAAMNSLTVTEAVVANPVVISLDDLFNTTCNGGTDGEIAITASGGTPPYTYDWADVAGTMNPEDRSGLSAGSYSLTVRDDLNVSSTANYMITEPSAIVITADTPLAACNGDDVLVTLSATGGAGNFLYSFDGGPSSPVDTASLAAGTYTVYAQDNNGCLDSLTFDVNEPAVLAASVDNVTPDNGSGNGAIDISVSGGTTPYMYSWSNADTSQDISGLMAGFFDVDVVDDSGCTTSLSNIEVTTVTSIAEVFENLLSIKTLPNELYIKNLTGVDISLKLFNLNGQVIQSETINGTEHVSIDGLSPGVYFYTLSDETNARRTAGKFIHK